jgi:hypothetical protein
VLLRVLGGPGSDHTRLRDCRAAVMKPVPDMPTCRQERTARVRERSPPLRLDPPSKAPGSPSLSLRIITIPTLYYNRINLR